MSSQEMRNRPKQLLSVLLKNFLDVKCPNCVSSLLKMTPAGSEKGSSLLEGPKEASSSNVRQEGPEANGLNMKDLKGIDFNSADEVRRMAKAVLKSGKAPDLRFNDPEPVESPAGEDGGTQKDIPMKLTTSAHEVMEKSPTKTKLKSKLLAKKEVSRQNNMLSKRKKKSKFVNICKRTVSGSVSRFYSGKLSNLMTNFGREDRRNQQIESSSDRDLSHIWS